MAQKFYQDSTTEESELQRILLSNLKQKEEIKTTCRNFPGGPVVKNPPSNAGDSGVWSLVRELRFLLPRAVTRKQILHVEITV